MIEFLTGLPYLKLLLIGFWLAYVLILGAWIVLQKRDPAATLSWIISLSLLPYVGFLIYYLIGPMRVHRQRLRRLRSSANFRKIDAFKDKDRDAVEL